MSQADISSTVSSPEDEGYQLEVNEVAELLGVTRTRVSQLTSNGQLSFERRRIGSRNRLFYRRSEVLAHQRGYWGRQPPSREGEPIHRSGAAAVALQSSEGDGRSGALAQFHRASQASLYPPVAFAARMQSPETGEWHAELNSMKKTLGRLEILISKSAHNSPLSAVALLEEHSNKELLQSLLKSLDELSRLVSAQEDKLTNLSEQVLAEFRTLGTQLHRLQNMQIRSAEKHPVSLACQVHPKSEPAQATPEVVPAAARACRPRIIRRHFRTAAARSLLRR